jgi:hypothetical protein
MKRASIVVGVLLAITALGWFVTAVRRVNTAANRTLCINRLKMICLALHGYHDVHKELPRAIYLPPTRELPPETQLSWMADVLPFIEEHRDPKRLGDESKPWNHPQNLSIGKKVVEMYLCPSNPSKETDGWGLAHYVGIGGIGDDAAWLPMGHLNAGVFGYERVTRMSDMRNGGENTIMVAETASNNGPWAQGGFTTARGLDLNGPAYLGKHGQFNSFHSHAITNVMFADGTFRSLTDETSDRVFESMATIAGRE